MFQYHCFTERKYYEHKGCHMREEKNQKLILQGPLLADILMKYVFELRKKHVITAGKFFFYWKTDA